MIVVDCVGTIIYAVKGMVICECILCVAYNINSIIYNGIMHIDTKKYGTFYKCIYTK